MLWAAPYEVFCGECRERVVRHIRPSLPEPDGVYYYRCMQPQCARYRVVLRVTTSPMIAKVINANEDAQPDVAQEDGEADHEGFFKRNGKCAIRLHYFGPSGSVDVEELYQAFRARMKAEG